jgi:hypothetical protein
MVKTKRISTIFRLPLDTRIQIDEMRKQLKLDKRTNTNIVVIAISDMYNKFKENKTIEVTDGR